MKSTILLAFGAIAGLASAQLPTLPDCAKSCVTQFTTGSSIGGCQASDIVCICEAKGFLSGIACCLASACSPADQTTAVDFAHKFCGLSGVTDLPASVTCSSTSAAASATSSAATATTKANSSSTTSPTSVDAKSTTASSSSGSASVKATSTATSSSSSSASTQNAGQKVEAGNVAGLGGLFALLALL